MLVMNACYYLVCLSESGNRFIYRNTYFDSLKSARLFAKSLPNVISIGRRNSQGCLFYKV